MSYESQGTPMGSTTFTGADNNGVGMESSDTIREEFCCSFVDACEVLVSECLADAAVGSTPKPGKAVEIAKGAGEAIGAGTMFLPAIEKGARIVSTGVGKVAEETTKSYCCDKRKEESRRVKDYFRSLPKENRVRMWVDVASALSFSFEQPFTCVTGAKHGTKLTGIVKLAHDAASRIINHIIGGEELSGRKEFSVKALVAAVVGGKSSNSSLTGKIFSAVGSDRKSGHTVNIGENQILTSKVFSNAVPVAVNTDGVIENIYCRGEPSGFCRRLLPWESTEDFVTPVHNKFDSVWKEFKFQLTIEWLNADRHQLVDEYVKHDPELRSRRVYDRVDTIDRKVDGVQELQRRAAQESETGTKEVLAALASGSAQISQVDRNVSLLTDCVSDMKITGERCKHDISRAAKTVNELKGDASHPLYLIQQQVYELDTAFVRYLAPTFTDWGTATEHGNVNVQRVNNLIADTCEREKSSQDGLVAVYECKTVGKQFGLEVIVLDKEIYNQLKDSVILVTDKELRTTRITHSNKEFVQFPINTAQVAPWSLFMGLHLLTPERIRDSKRVVVFTCGVASNQDIKNQLIGFAQCDDPQFHFKSRIPSAEHSHIPRMISNTIVVDAKVLLAKCSDVFVIMGVKKEALEVLAGSNVVRNWSKKNSELYCRHVVLDNEAEWGRLVARCRPGTPLHLLRMRGDNFFLLQSTLVTETLRQHESPRDSNDYTSESDLLKKIVTGKDLKVVVICDTTGTGKSWLMKKLAQDMKEKNTFVFYMELRGWEPRHSPESDDSLVLFLEHLCKRQRNLAAQILEHVRLNGSRLVVFMDGLDEAENPDKMIRHLHNLSKMDNLQLVVSSCSNLRSALEKTFGVISYVLQPFRRTQMVDAITTQWGDHENPEWRNFAGQCIDSIKELESEDSYEDVLGDPLKCLLLAKINEKHLDDLPVTRSVTIKSVRCLHEMFFNAALEKFGQGDCKLKARLLHVHVYQAMLRHNPGIAKSYKLIKRIKNQDFCKLPAMGMLRYNLSGELEFVHGSFTNLFMGIFFVRFWYGVDEFKNKFFKSVGLFFIQNMLHTNETEISARGASGIYKFIVRLCFDCPYCNMGMSEMHWDSPTTKKLVVFKLSGVLSFMDHLSQLDDSNIVKNVSRFKGLLSNCGFPNPFSPSELGTCSGQLEKKYYSSVLACIEQGFPRVLRLLDFIAKEFFTAEELSNSLTLPLPSIRECEKKRPRHGETKVDSSRQFRFGAWFLFSRLAKRDSKVMSDLVFHLLGENTMKHLRDHIIEDFPRLKAPPTENHDLLPVFRERSGCILYRLVWSRYPENPDITSVDFELCPAY